MQSTRKTSLVSVVIPTRNRPQLACRAVSYALQQTYLNLEVIVVVDGPDPATVLALQSLQEPRLHILPLDENVGGSEARNVGARAALGEWIALLDDDDEWVPKKIERQMLLAATLDDTNAFIACRFSTKPLAGPRSHPPDCLDRRSLSVNTFSGPTGCAAAKVFFRHRHC